mgnify:CR=1 FL=1
MLHQRARHQELITQPSSPCSRIAAKFFIELDPDTKQADAWGQVTATVVGGHGFRLFARC